MDNQMIRLLDADEIECRAAIVNEKGLSLLLYKDARVDQRILDETFGAFGWKRSHQSINGNLYCTVEIRDRETGEWVAKQDVGTTGYAEKEKSQASDSFKRACFNWGIGRELYSAPFIWVPAGKACIQKKGDKWYCNDRFSVSEISYNGSREIESLSVVNDKGAVVYELGGRKPASVSPKPAPVITGAITDAQMHSLEAELKRIGVGMDAVKKRYQIDQPKDMTEELYGKVMKALAKTKSVA